MKTMKKILSMAALALVGAVMTGCSNDDNVQQSPNNDKVITLTTTLSLDNDDATNRALAVDFGNKKATKTFAEGDMIVVFYKDANNLTRRVQSNPLTAGNIHNDGKSADFTMTFMNTPGVNAQLRYVYPYFDSQPSIDTDAEINDANTLCYDYIDDQFGRLSKNDYLDLATFDGNFSGTSLPASASLTNRLAILAFTLKNSDGSSAITSSILNMNISDGINSYNVMSVDEDVIYAAIHPLTTPTALVITATDKSSNNYTKTLTSRTYPAGSFNHLTLKMPNYPIALSAVTGNAYVGSVVTTDGNVYPTVAAANADTKTAVAKITYVGSETGVAGKTHGLALSLSNVSTANYYWATAISACASKTPAVTNASSWMLPSKDQWNKMITAAGSYTALRAGFSGVGGTNLNSGTYWSSTDHTNESNAWAYKFNNGSWGAFMKNASTEKYTRACIAF